MRLELIACEVLRREFTAAISRSGYLIEPVWMSKDLHLMGGGKMRARIQAAIDETPPNTFDAIVLGYALCGNGLAGVEARSTHLVLPRAHDCIALLMGSRLAFNLHFQTHPGAYYRSSGWVEHASSLEPLARTRTGASYTLESLIERYGDDNGRYLYEELSHYRRKYRQLTFIDTGTDPGGRFREKAVKEAEECGWLFESLTGGLDYFCRLLDGRWDHSDFLIVPPGHRIRASHDDQIISLEEPAS